MDTLFDNLRMRQNLLRTILLEVREKADATGLQAALRLSALVPLIRQDACEAAVARAASGTGDNGPARAGEEGPRQARPKGPAVPEQAGMDATSSGPLPPRGRSGHASPPEEWAQETVPLLREFYAHQAAVELIQAEHFDGHPILPLDVEAQMAETARTIECAVAMFNEYLKRRAEFLNAGLKPEACEGAPPIDIESIKAGVRNGRAVALADDWLRLAKEWRK